MVEAAEVAVGGVEGGEGCLEGGEVFGLGGGGEGGGVGGGW